MTVGELIVELQKLPESYEVVEYGWSCYNDEPTTDIIDGVLLENDLGRVSFTLE